MWENSVNLHRPKPALSSASLIILLYHNQVAHTSSKGINFLIAAICLRLTVGTL